MIPLTVFVTFLCSFGQLVMLLVHAECTRLVHLAVAEEPLASVMLPTATLLCGAESPWRVSGGWAPWGIWSQSLLEFCDQFM